MQRDPFDIVNVYIHYYRQTHKIKDKKFLLDGIDYSKDTFENEYLSEFIEDVKEYKKNINDPEKIKVYDSSDTAIDDDIYVLKIGGTECKYCYTIIPLIQFISTINDWHKINWKIEKIVSL
uniref:Uncharacterized protein n=1 Tax=Mimivirus LCMiAC01 TaxID=2506608 RepID=A0A481Z391_9VIRU|nr:MAG: hypothetical protein LCMiAC01_05380 [Mimivirus LCMiAC01]